MTATCLNPKGLFDDSHKLEHEEPDYTGPTETAIKWRSSRPMPERLYNEALARLRRRQIVEDDFVPLTRSYAVTQLTKSQKWLENQQRHRSVTPEDRRTAQNIMLGCLDLVTACGMDAAAWAKRKPKRLRRLRQAKKGWKTKVGHKDLCDLIRLAISCLDAAGWLDMEVIESVHLPRWTKPKTLARPHVDKMQAGRRARRAEEQARREARLGTFYCESG